MPQVARDLIGETIGLYNYPGLGADFFPACKIRSTLRSNDACINARRDPEIVNQKLENEQGEIEMKNILLIAALMVASVAAAFGQAERLGTRQWKLIQVDGANVSASSKAYLELNADESRFTGNAGCNRMFGAVDVQGRRIDFSNVATTKMACVDPRVRRVETNFVKALENVDRFRLRQNSLELIDRNRVVARLTAMRKLPPVDDHPRNGLTDSKWMLEAIKGVPVGRVAEAAFLVFDESKRSSGGNSSCNVFGGSYTSKGSTLMITDVIATMRACVEDNRMNIEREFLDGLRETNRYEIQKGRLLLYRNQRLLLTLRGERK
jgi:heat shock protein HslJ